MNYFVNNNVFSFNNGPEFSSYERLKAFNDHGLSAKLVLKDYSQYLSQDLKTHQISRKNVINMYDYFQEITDEPSEPVGVHHLPSLPFKQYHLTFIDNNVAGIDWMGHRKGLIHFAPSSVAKVGKIDYYDRFGHVIQSELWDWRGFLSRVDNYHPDGSISTSRYLRRDGSTAIIVTHMNINGQVQPTMWKLINYNTKNLVFDSENDLFVFFLNEINKNEQGTFFSDRRVTDNYVLSVENPISTVACVHNVPVKDPEHLKNSPLLDTNNALFNYDHQSQVAFDHIVFPTKDEADFFQKRFQRNLPNTLFENANDSFVEVVESQKTLPARKSVVVAFRGMMGNAKNTSELVKAFKNLSKHFKIANLKLQGYFQSPQEEKELNDLTKKLGVDLKTKILPYKPFDKSFFDKANLFINPTQSEAFGMNALEAMAAGLPVVTYDVPYIANNLVKNGENGLFAKRRNPQKLADAANSLMNDKELYEKLSEGAIETAKRFNEDAMFDDWQRILE